jgi:hypothetical protein
MSTAESPPKLLQWTEINIPPEIHQILPQLQREQRHCQAIYEVVRLRYYMSGHAGILVELGNERHELGVADDKEKKRRRVGAGRVCASLVCITSNSTLSTAINTTSKTTPSGSKFATTWLHF